MKKKLSVLTAIFFLFNVTTYSQIGVILLDSTLIKIEYEKFDDTTFKVKFNISNHSGKSIFIAGDIANGKLIVQPRINRESDTVCFVHLGKNDPSYNQINDSDIYLFEVHAYKTWYPDSPLFVKSISSIKGIYFTFIKNIEDKKLKISNGTYHTSAKNYKKNCSSFKIEFY